MKNSAYWQKRFETLEEALGKYGEETYRGVQPYFDKALREINADIETWIYRIAKNNEISMANAKKLLDANQLEEFKWSVEEYIKYGKENAINQQWIKQLENASAKFHISRLEALKIQVQQSAEKAFGNYLDDVDAMAKKVYEEGYYRSAFELQKGFGIGWNIASIDEKKLSKLISKPWAADGKNFSDRIWQAKSQMVYDLHSELTRACILGKGPDEAIKNLSKYVDKRFKNAKVQAGRLVMTEQAFFSAAAQKDCFNELGVEEYEIVATLDSHTSEICQELDGKHFPMSQYEEGVTAPPFHVWCRSTTCPYFDDEFTVGEMRVARGEDGKTYHVPADMTYPEWKELQKDANDKSESLHGVEAGDIILNKDETIKRAKELATSVEYETASNFQEIRAITNEKLGYDAKPTVIDEATYQEISKERLKLYRGVHSGNGKTAEEIVNEFKYGALWTGNTGGAIAGNGVYFTATESIAKSGSYAGNDGSIIEMILADDAKIADFVEIFTEFESTGIPKIIGMPKEDYQYIIRDVGQYAAVKGYDAIALNGYRNQDYVVLLNRKKAIVKE